jgi:hypothetical protein
MTKLRVEVLETNGFMDGRVKRENGDIFSSEMGAEYVRLGWCKNTVTGETGTRVEGVQKLNVDNVLSLLQ